MRTLLLICLLVFGQSASADFLSENQGHWEGQGVLESGQTWPFYVHFQPNRAEVYSYEDGCEANWNFTRVTPHMMEGWEELLVGFDRCHAGLKFVVTRHDASRLKVEWQNMHGVFIAEGFIWRVQ